MANGLVSLDACTIEDALDYGEKGCIKGFDPEVAGWILARLDALVEARSEECEECEECDCDEDDYNDLETNHKAALAVLRKIFDYPPNQQWFAAEYETFIELNNNA